MLIGILVIVLSFLLVGALLVWGIMYTRKHSQENWKEKYRLAFLLLSLGLVLSISYIASAKKFMHNIDLIIAWLILSTGLMFSASVVFFVGYFSDKRNELH